MIWSAIVKSMLVTTAVATSYGFLAVPSGAVAQSENARACSSAAYGAEPDPKSVVRAGPIGFIARFYAQAGRGQFAPVGRHRYRPSKLAVIVDEGATATVSVPRSDQRRFSLLYTGDASPDGNQIRDGTRSVTFQACKANEGPGGNPNHSTIFTGYVLTAGPRCVPLRVEADGVRYGTVLRFGVQHC